MGNLIGMTCFSYSIEVITPAQSLTRLQRSIFSLCQNQMQMETQLARRKPRWG